MRQSLDWLSEDSSQRIKSRVSSNPQTTVHSTRLSSRWILLSRESWKYLSTMAKQKGVMSTRSILRKWNVLTQSHSLIPSSKSIPRSNSHRFQARCPNCFSRSLPRDSISSYRSLTTCVISKLTRLSSRRWSRSQRNTGKLNSVATNLHLGSIGRKVSMVSHYTKSCQDSPAPIRKNRSVLSSIVKSMRNYSNWNWSRSTSKFKRTPKVKGCQRYRHWQEWQSLWLDQTKGRSSTSCTRLIQGSLQIPYSQPSYSWLMMCSTKIRPRRCNRNV